MLVCRGGGRWSMSPRLMCLEDRAFSKSLFSIMLLASFSCDFPTWSPCRPELLKVEAVTHHNACGDAQERRVCEYKQRKSGFPCSFSAAQMGLASILCQGWASGPSSRLESCICRGVGSIAEIPEVLFELCT